MVAVAEKETRSGLAKEGGLLDDEVQDFGSGANRYDAGRERFARVSFTQ